MKTIYTTIGSVRGCCGHKHKTYEAAQACMHADQAGCARHGGYSDRQVVSSDDDGYLIGENGQPYYPHGRGSRAAHVADMGGRI